MNFQKFYKHSKFSQAQMAPDIQNQLQKLYPGRKDMQYTEISPQQFSTNFQPILSFFSSERGLDFNLQPVRQKVAAAMKNAAQVIDSFVNAAKDKKAAMAVVNAKLNELKSLPIVSASNEMLSTFLPMISKFSTAFGGKAPSVDMSILQQPGKEAPAKAAPAVKAPEHIDVKQSQKELFLASDITKGIAAALKKPGANKKVLLSRLNKYRLNPMAKLFNQLSQKQGLSEEEQQFLANLKGLFVQVEQTFNDEEKAMLKEDPEVKQALEASHTLNLRSASLHKIVKKLSAKY